MRLSEKLKIDHECGDFGRALEGYAERAASLEEIVEAVAHIGIDWGVGEYVILPTDPMVEKARNLLAPNKANPADDPAICECDFPKHCENNIIYTDCLRCGKPGRH